MVPRVVVCCHHLVALAIVPDYSDALYWLGRLAPHLRGALAVKVRVGEREAAWSLRVGPREKR